MDLFDVARICLRRWYFLTPLLLVTAWFSLSAYSSAQPVYYGNAVLGLAPPSVRIDVPSSGSNEVRRNGLLDVGGAALVANLLALGLEETTVVQRVTAGGGDPSYSANVFPVVAPNPQLPLIMIEVSAADPATVSTTLALVIAEANPTLTTIQQQANVPDDQMVSTFVVSPPSQPAVAMPTRTRSTITIFVAGAGLSILVTLLLDVLLTRRRERIRTRTAETRPGMQPPVHPPVAEPEHEVPSTASSRAEPT